MIDAYCPGHGHAVLLGHHAIDRVRNTESGIEVHLNCHCGAHLVVETGRRTRPPLATTF
jgi:hypothetical protein